MTNPVHVPQLKNGEQPSQPLSFTGVGAPAACDGNTGRQSLSAQQGFTDRKITYMTINRQNGFTV